MGMREKLIELIGNMRRKITAWHTIEDIADMLIANGVTIPVRCKDCKMRCPDSVCMAKHCTLSGIPVDDDDFCSYGERKDNG